MHLCLSTFHRLSVLACILLGLCATVLAEPAAKATLSQQSAEIGEEIQFMVHVSGASKMRPPDLQPIEGLTFSQPRISQNQSFSLMNGNFASVREATLVYSVVPEKAGSYVIPALTVLADGHPVQTEPVGLKVESGKAGADPQGGAESDRLLWLELSTPKTTAYVGETIPAELRLYTSVQIGMEDMPEIAGEGFTQTKLPAQPPRSRVQRNGREYDVFTFETAITPTKAGKLRFGPGGLNVRAAIPRAQPRRQRAFPDPFEDFFGSGPFLQTQTRKLIAEPIEIAVKPLPAKDRPADFDGAVGQFTLSSQGTPNRVKIGDPVTMVLKVGGSGNFDRVTAPVLADPDGWRSYPPSSSFKADDPTGVHGVKKFEIAVIPEQKKTSMPLYRFSFFDPAAEKYVTLSSSKAPLQVDGQSLPPPPPVANVTSQPSTGQAHSSTAVNSPVPVPTDIHGISYEFGKPESIEPLYSQHSFWLAQCIPAALLAGLISLRFKKRRPDSGRVAALRREHARNLAHMRGVTDRMELYDCAVRALQAESAIRTGQPAPAVDAAAVCCAHRLDPSVARGVEEIFHARAEVVYAGGGGGGEKLSDEERQRVTATVNHVAAAK